MPDQPTVTVKLTEAEVARLRMAAADRLNSLGEAGMDDKELRRLIIRLSEAMEKKLGSKYTQRF
jgi:phenylpyruvate tautomerase PptA (4-oxalocrotonate tautomerase family)